MTHVEIGKIISEQATEKLRNDWMRYEENKTPQFYEALNAQAEQLKIDLENEVEMTLSK